jgi:hypothetical protein
LDLLGYRSVLSKLDMFPLPGDPSASAALSAAFGRAVKLRRRLSREVEDFLAASENVPPPDLSHLPPETQKVVAGWRKVRLLRSPGPDHLVLGCSLSPADGHFPMRAVYSLVTTAASAMLFQLMIGSNDPDDTLPLRGGIDIAAGELIQPENFLYSPALTRAYDLESKHAVYARTIAGPRLLDYLAAHINTDEKTPEAQHNRILASRIAECFFADRDGVLALDFMGKAMRKYAEGTDPPKMAGQAWKYVNEAHSRIRATGNFDVAAKYAWLIDYMRERLPLWGVVP